MKAREESYVEFTGGPEDGLVLHESILELLESKLSLADGRDIPLMFRRGDDGSATESEGGDLVLLGLYVREEGRLPVKYRWVEIG
jgi:hypothetical protein